MFLPVQSVSHIVLSKAFGAERRMVAIIYQLHSVSSRFSAIDEPLAS